MLNQNCSAVALQKTLSNYLQIHIYVFYGLMFNLPCVICLLSAQLRIAASDIFPPPTSAFQSRT